MERSRSILGTALRCAAAGLGAVAIGAVFHPQRLQPHAEVLPAAPQQALAPDPPAALADPPPRWSLQVGGWYIRVDGANVPLPSLSEQMRARPGAGLAISISPFDRLIAYHAQAEGFDWRLIAALIFEESRFDPTSRSNKGAVGLMQVRPIAAEAVGATEFMAPADNVQTGVRYLRQLDDIFHAARGRDRLAIILAAYNAGPGHVRDAQMLARTFGYDPNRWQDALELMLPLLEEASIYEHLPNGYAKGSDIVAYVGRILERYERYKRQTLSPDIAANGDALPLFAESNGGG